VGSFDFAESRLLAEVYSQALERNGFTVRRAFGLGPREIVAPALAQGLVELVPEYAGTALRFFSLGDATPSADPDTTHEALRRALETIPVTALAGAPAQNANTFVVTADTAEELGLRRLSDLSEVAPTLTFGGPPECPTRPLCLRGLEEVYGLRFGAILALDPDGHAAAEALDDGAADVALLFTTDPEIAPGRFVELVDDRRLQPAESITPLVRDEVIRQWGDAVVGPIDDVSRRLTTDGLRALNARAVGVDAAVVASEWLDAEGL
jgi:osmoprotectant transport system substrate-binding protein